MTCGERWFHAKRLQEWAEVSGHSVFKSSSMKAPVRYKGAHSQDRRR